MDDLIYILLGLAWIALAFYRNSQKKKLREQQRAQSLSQQAGDSQEEKSPGTLLEEILLGEEYEEATTEPAYGFERTDPFESLAGQERMQEPRVTTAWFEEEYGQKGIDSVEELDLERGKVNIREGIKSTEDLQLVELEVEEKEPLDFDLRKAVIYSEILNPRYF